MYGTGVVAFTALFFFNLSFFNFYKKLENVRCEYDGLDG